MDYPVFTGRREPYPTDRQTRPSRSRKGQYTETGPFVNRLRTNILQKVVHWWTDPVEYGCTGATFWRDPGARATTRTVIT